METKMTTGIKLASLICDEVDKGSPRWANRGLQSRGWKILGYVQKRYSLPRGLVGDIINGFLRIAKD